MTFVEDSTTQSWGERSICSPAYFFNGLLSRGSRRDDRWTKNIAVGSREYVEQVAAELGSRALYRKVGAVGDGQFVQREGGASYPAFSPARIAG